MATHADRGSLGPLQRPLTRLELQRRREQLQLLLDYLDTLEQDHSALHARASAFAARYDAQLGSLYAELDAVEGELHAATRVLAEALQRQGVLPQALQPPPPSPRITAGPALMSLPERPALPPEPEADTVELPPPTLKTLYRRAAMRLHPDLAPTDAERAAREQQMMEVNEAYAAEHRPRLEALLLAAGESPERVLGGTAPALKHWLSQCEQIVQARTRVVQAQLAWLRTQALTRMCEAVERAELTGLRPLDIMAARLRTQITERRQELYIGQRLQADDRLAVDFLRTRYSRMTGYGLR
ncbi:J domain-containing protein [Roseateles sp.]|uniref:J domain-containing protein n=1 Tax=Roseateles sp. TaxID=1971397 RepID=UPI00395B21EF